MVAQATTRNKKAIERGRVDLRHGPVASLPFADNAFDKALAINSMQVWPDAVAGSREMRRCMRTGGTVALGFTPYSGQPNTGLAETFTAAGQPPLRRILDRLAREEILDAVLARDAACQEGRQAG